MHAGMYVCISVWEITELRRLKPTEKIKRFNIVLKFLWIGFLV